MRAIVFAFACGLLALPVALSAQAQTPSPDGARAYIVSPSDGATVSNPVTVVFGLEGMGVAPAGVEQENTGHHHLLIDDPDFALGEPLPADDTVVHFGGGQTQTTIELPSGNHTLQILLGDHNHIPHVPPVRSKKITIAVE